MQATAGKMLQKGVMDKLQKAKQVQAKVNLLIQSFWLPAWHKPVSKKKLLEYKACKYHPELNI